MINLSALLAQGRRLGDIGEGEGFGPWADLADKLDVAPATRYLATIVSNVIGLMTIVGGIWFIFQLIWGAYDYLYAGAEAERVQKAKKRISNAIIGLVIVVAAFAITSLLGSILGIEILDPGSVIESFAF